MASEETENRDHLVGRVVDEYFLALEAGKRPQLGDFVRRYPEIADVLTTVIPAMQTSEPAEKNVLGERSEDERLLGDFRILRQIGRGGMGVVYQAEQISMRRHVALKVLPLAGLLDEPKILRFQSEVRAVASLDHPNIVSVYSVGEERGTHYFAMQLISGSSLAEVIRAIRHVRDGESREEEAVSQIANSILSGNLESVSATEDFDSDAVHEKATQETIHASGTSTIPHQSRRDSTRAIVALMVQAADALEHAHGRGIVHRDIKPANLLVDAHARLFVTDFGLAQVEADAGVTMTGDLLGTLRYMAPEQTLAKRVTVDHRADIYSLGATLYELLALQPAFPSDDRHELLKQVAFEEPKQLCQVNATIPAELETIVQKAMSKDRDDRYETAKALRDDLTRYLENRPILARRPGPLQVASKWIGRNPTLVLTTLASFAFVAILFAASNSMIARERDEAKSEFQRANVTRLASDSRALQAEQPTLSMLIAIAAVAESEKADVEKALAHESLLNASQILPRTKTLGTSAADQISNEMVSEVLMAERWLVTRGDAGVLLWDLAAPGNKPVVLRKDPGTALCLSGDKRWLVAIGNQVQRWDLDSPQSSAAIPVGSKILKVRMSNNGDTIALLEAPADSSKHATVSLWDCTMPKPARIRTLAHPNDGISLFEFNLHGQSLITASNKSEPFLLEWDIQDSTSEPVELTGHKASVVDICQNIEGRELATLDRKRMLIRNATEPEQPIRTVEFNGHFASDRVLLHDFSKLFLRQAYTSRLHGFDLSAEAPTQSVTWMKGHTIDISQLKIAADGKTLVSAARDGTVRFWDTGVWPPTTQRTFRAQDAVNSMSLHDDGRWLATAGVDGTARLWDLSRPESSDPKYVLNGMDDDSFSSTTISSNGRWIATTVQGNRLQLWDTNSEKPTTFSRVLENSDSAFSNLAISSDDRWLVASCHDSSVHLWDLTATDLVASERILPGPEGLELAEGDSSARLALGPRNRWIAVSYGEYVRLWDLAARKPSVTNLPGQVTEAVSLAISPDGQWLAAGDRGSLRLWDLTLDEPEKQAAVLKQVKVWSLAFDHDSRYLYSASEDTVERWDLTDLNSKPFAIPPENVESKGIWRMAISNDRNWLVTTRFSRNAQLWDLRGKKPSCHDIPTQLGIQTVDFSPDNHWLVTGGPSNARLWDLTADDPLQSARVLRGHRENIWAVAFSTDSRWLVTDASDGKIRRWCLDTAWLIENSREIIGRTLTQEERSRYRIQ